MGLIKALTGSVIGTVLDTWKDYFVCDSLDNDTLMVKGTKRGFGGSGDVITNGSGIIVNEGQCALIIEEECPAPDGDLVDLLTVELHLPVLGYLHSGHPLEQIL